MQALVRPLAEHHALFDLTAGHRAMSDVHAIHCAEDFARLLADPHTPRELLVSVSASREVWLDVLTQHPYAAVWVAVNRHLPDEIVEHLAAHPGIQVRAALASNSRVRDDLMMGLAHDKSELIRLRVVCNAHVSREVLVALTNDPCQLVSTRAQARLVHDISGVSLPPSYLDQIEVLSLLH
ncbi:hypothetical protein [Ideonella sp. BN130291]|uniref:hypothetical protein n=1 Tax=Ideonella sp. BN130291 TaxID=3112940 RepID=UPI002E271B93|nr:hypothetical protein [Ideonella sp. BN130291]